MNLLWGTIDILGVLAILISVPIQWRALNRIAFGRSMFISGTAIVFGWFLGLRHGIGAGLVSASLLLFGFWMIIFMAIKSAQHMRAVKQSRR